MQPWAVDVSHGMALQAFMHQQQHQQQHHHHQQQQLLQESAEHRMRQEWEDRVKELRDRVTRRNLEIDEVHSEKRALREQLEEHVSRIAKLTEEQLATRAQLQEETKTRENTHLRYQQALLATKKLDTVLKVHDADALAQKHAMEEQKQLGAKLQATVDRLRNEIEQEKQFATIATEKRDTQLFNELGQLQHAHANLQQAHAQLQHTHSQLVLAHTQLHPAHAKLQQTHAQLQLPHLQLQQTHAQLQQSFAQMQITNAQLIASAAEARRTSIGKDLAIRKAEEESMRLKEQLRSLMAIKQEADQREASGWQLEANHLNASLQVAHARICEFEQAVQQQSSPPQSPPATEGGEGAGAGTGTHGRKRHRRNHREHRESPMPTAKQQQHQLMMVTPTRVSRPLLTSNRASLVVVPRNQLPGFLEASSLS